MTKCTWPACKCRTADNSGGTVYFCEVAAIDAALKQVSGASVPVGLPAGEQTGPVAEAPTQQQAEPVAYRIRRRAVLKTLPSYKEDGGFGPWHAMTKMPPPSPLCGVDRVGYEYEAQPLYTADQMRAYGRAARKAAEAFARAVERTHGIGGDE